MKKKDYYSNYIQNEEGKYDYAGKEYHYDCDIPFKRAHTVVISLLSCSLVLLIICGFLPADGLMNTFYVIMPFAISFVSLFYECFQSFRIKEVMKDFYYDKVIEGSKTRIIIIFILIVATVIGQCIQLAFSREVKSMFFSILFIVLLVITLLVLYFALQFIKRLKWK